MDIPVQVVRTLIDSQFPEWAGLPLAPVEPGGHDNRTFHLGTAMSVRLPSAERYVPQVEKELYWLPRLQPHLSLPIPKPLAEGKPGAGYPWPWSVNEWLDGEAVSTDNVADKGRLAADLSHFLKQLQAVDLSDGPPAGEHNFYRGGPLSVYHEETMRTLDRLRFSLDVRPFAGMWDMALRSKWAARPVWVHGDVAPGNLLVRHGRLGGVIDFGMLGVGDPACDLAMAWTFFDSDSRKRFVRAMGLDGDTWMRARGWALWKALIVYDRGDKRSSEAVAAKRVMDVIVNDAAPGRYGD